MYGQFLATFLQSHSSQLLTPDEEIALVDLISRFAASGHALTREQLVIQVVKILKLRKPNNASGRYSIPLSEPAIRLLQRAEHGEECSLSKEF